MSCVGVGGRGRVVGTHTHTHYFHFSEDRHLFTMLRGKAASPRRLTAARHATALSALPPQASTRGGRQAGRQEQEVPCQPSDRDVEAGVQ